jgi:hypothetical protein
MKQAHQILAGEKAKQGKSQLSYVHRHLRAASCPLLSFFNNDTPGAIHPRDPGARSIQAAAQPVHPDQLKQQG